MTVGVRLFPSALEVASTTNPMAEGEWEREREREIERERERERERQRERERPREREREDAPLTKRLLYKCKNHFDVGLHYSLRQPCALKYSTRDTVHGTSTSTSMS